jgi:hypothetical protein
VAFRNNFILKLFFDAKIFKPASAAVTKLPKGTRLQRHRSSLVPREQPVLSSDLLTATLFFLLAPLTFPVFSVAIFLSAALLSGGMGFAWFVWILLCVHDGFLCYLRLSHFTTGPL